jgi:hypothetical protein
MPASDIFSFEVLVNGHPLPEYIPEADDYDYPLCQKQIESDLDRVSYVEASPGSEFIIRTTYLGADTLSTNNSYAIYLYVDGAFIDGKLFSTANHSSMIETKRLQGGMEQT